MQRDDEDEFYALFATAHAEFWIKLAGKCTHNAHAKARRLCRLKSLGSPTPSSVIPSQTCSSPCGAMTRTVPVSWLGSAYLAAFVTSPVDQGQWDCAVGGKAKSFVGGHLDRPPQRREVEIPANVPQVIAEIEHR
jgi:hypothetical protein